MIASASPRRPRSSRYTPPRFPDFSGRDIGAEHGVSLAGTGTSWLSSNEVHTGSRLQLQRDGADRSRLDDTASSSHAPTPAPDRHAPRPPPPSCYSCCGPAPRERSRARVPFAVRAPRTVCDGLGYGPDLQCVRRISPAPAGLREVGGNAAVCSPNLTARHTVPSIEARVTTAGHPTGSFAVALPATRLSCALGVHGGLRHIDPIATFRFS